MISCSGKNFWTGKDLRANATTSPDPKYHRIFKGGDSYEIMENRLKYCYEIVEKAFENMH